MAAWSGIFSHGSQDAIRLCGIRYIEIDPIDRPGYATGPVTVGDFTFVGAGATIRPGVGIGRGCRIDAGAIVTRDIPDFSIVRGIPARIVGDVREIDCNYFGIDGVKENYFDPGAMQDWRTRSKE